MRIRCTWTIGRRVVEPYEWNAANNHVVEIEEPELVAELLSHPPQEFTVADDEPLLVELELTRTQIGSLALANIATIAGLAALDKEAISALAETLAVSRQQMQAWVRKARVCVARQAQAATSALADAQEPTDATTLTEPLPLEVAVPEPEPVPIEATPEPLSPPTAS